VVRAAKNSTKTIPIVMTGRGIDPVEAGLVDSLARPGGNVTGITNLSIELGGSSWSCSKKPFPKPPVSRFSTILPIGAMYSG
jgi:putative ABC transport system substrate-binding protein